MKGAEQNYLFFSKNFFPMDGCLSSASPFERFSVVNSNLVRPRLKLGKIEFGMQRLRYEQRLIF
jgi:hypothetical protein